MNKFIDTFDIDIGDKTFSVGVEHCLVVPPYAGSPHTCDNDMDYFGYTEIEFVLLDEDGNEMPGANDKLTEHERDLIEQKIINS